MVTFLSKIFIKNYKKYENPEVRRSYGILNSLIGIFLNIMLFIGKYFAGIISGSIAITADAFNNLSDAGSSLITLIGFKLSGKKPDHEHPFGHGRIEYISGLAVSFIILLMGLELVKSSFMKILHPVFVNTSVLAIAILVISICVKMYMALYNTIISKKISSAAMKATATDSLSDSAATLVVLISMIFLKMSGINIDGYSGLLVAVFILFAGFNSAKDTLSPLLGQAPDEDFVNKIRDIVMSHEEILGIHDLVVHDYGPGRLMISLHGEVSGDGNIFELHDAIDRIETELNEKLHCESVIHMDPIESDDSEIKIMKNKVAQLLKTIDDEISIHDFRMVTGPTHTNLIFDAVIPYHTNLSDDEAAKKIKMLIHDTYSECFAVVKIDRSYTN